MLKTISSLEESFKCGMVYCNKSAVYSVHCNYCDGNVKFDDFQKHFRIKHFSLIRKEEEEPQRFLRSSTATTRITSFADRVSVPTTTTAAKNQTTSSRLKCSPTRVTATTTTPVPQEKTDPISIEMALKSEEEKQEEDDDDMNFFEDEVPIDMVALGLNKIESTLTNSTEPIMDVSKSITKEDKDKDDSDDSLFESDDDNVPNNTAAKSDSDSLFDSDDSRFGNVIKKKDQSFPCDICGREFKLQRSVRTHKKRLHKNRDITKIDMTFKTSTVPSTKNHKASKSSANSPKRKVIKIPQSANTSQNFFKDCDIDFSTNDSTSDAVQQQLDIAMATLDNENKSNENADTEPVASINKEQSATAASSQTEEPTISSTAQLNSESDDFENDSDDNFSDSSLFESDPPPRPSFPAKRAKSTKPPSQISQTQEETMNFECPHCEKRLLSRGNLFSHISIAHNPSSLRDAVVKIETEKIKQCNDEQQRDTTTTNSRRTSSKLIDYSCQQCNENFRKENQLVCHIVKVHNNNSCDFCGKTYKSTHVLIDHRRSHTGEKRFKCPDCDKSFCSNLEMNSHRQRHRPIKEFICHVCGHKCNGQGSLHRHMRRHTGERPFKCRVCGQGFFEGFDRNVHESGHYDDKPFRCDICGGSFRHQKALRVHKKTHVKERNAACTLCDKRFINERGLKEHMRMHNRTESSLVKKEENWIMDEEFLKTMT